MTSPPSPPNRRRRRIVVTIAVLMLSLGWWFWPRVDQQFVGKWSATDDNVPAFTLTLDGDGLGLCEISGFKSTRPDATTLINRRIRSFPPRRRVVTIVWSPRPAASAFRMPQPGG